MKTRNPVTIQQVARAREMMRDGYSMKESSRLLGVISGDLDRALWSHVGTDVEAVIADKPQPHPMF